MAGSADSEPVRLLCLCCPARGNVVGTDENSLRECLAWLVSTINARDGDGAGAETLQLANLGKIKFVR
jgi:hypothetical protein